MGRRVFTIFHTSSVDDKSLYKPIECICFYDVLCIIITFSLVFAVMMSFPQTFIYSLSIKNLKIMCKW